MMNIDEALYISDKIFAVFEPYCLPWFGREAALN